MTLNAAQKDAVESEENLLCCACPGSGKTRVLVEKVRHVLATHPDPRIVMTTFSRDAANEMLNRIRHSFNEDECPKAEVAAKMQRLTIGTFHSLSLRQLQGAGKVDKILSEVETRHLLHRSLHQAIEQLGKDGKALIKGVTVGDLDSPLTLCRMDREFAARNPEFALIARIYCDMLAEAEASDFTDLLLKTNAMMLSREIAPIDATHVFTDEFQDADASQFEWLMHHLGPGRLGCAVGDDDQSIYSFRNSRGYQGMMNYVAATGARIITLDTNYRSTAGIVDTASNVIRHNIERVAKRIHAGRGPGPLPKVILIDKEDPRSLSAGAMIASKLRELCALNPPQKSADGKPPSAFNVLQGQAAVLARTNRQLDEVEALFAALNIPYARSGKSFWDGNLPQVYLSLLQTLCGDNGIGFEVVLRWSGVADRELHALSDTFPSVRDFVLHQPVSTLTDQCPPAVRSLLRESKGWLKTLSSGGSEGAATAVVTGAGRWMHDDLDRRIDAAERAGGSKENLIDRLRSQQKVIDLCCKSMGQASGTLRGRIQRVRTKPKKDAESVQLSTFHSSKGLEWLNVFLIDIHGGSVPKIDADASDAAVAEERRIFYVAMTRARDNLWIYGDGNCPVSEFLLESELQIPAFKKKKGD